MDETSDDTPDAGSSVAGGSRKRPAPTIELTASEVKDAPQQPVTPDEPVKTEESPQHRGWRARFGGKDSAAPEAADAAPADSTASSGQAETAEAPEAESPAFQDTPPPSRVGTAMVAALSGAVVSLVVAGGWSAMESKLRTPEAPPITPAQNLAIDSLNTRLTKLENKPSSPSPRDEDRMQSALATLGEQVASLQKDVETLRTQLESTSASVASLKSSDGNGDQAQALSAIDSRLSKLEQNVTTLSRPQPVRDSAADVALRRAVVAATLDQSVGQGVPYATALTAAARLDANAASLKPLQLFAATGVPSVAEMSRELITLLKPLAAERAALPPSASWQDRLTSSVVGLVQITRADQAGTDRASLLRRAEAAARREDLPEARRIVAQLPESDRAALKGWTEKAAARDAALSASRRFAQEASAVLQKSSPGAAQ